MEILLFGISEVGVACVETHWHSPRLSANAGNMVILKARYNRWLNYISTGPLFQKVSVKTDDLTLLFYLFARD